MAYVSRTFYTYSFSVNEYAIVFDYTDEDYIEVYADDNLILRDNPGWEYSTDGLDIDTTNAGLVGGEALEIRRVTDGTNRQVDYSKGAFLSEADLDLAHRQDYNLAGEGRDIGAEMAEPHIDDDTIHVPPDGETGDVLAKVSAADGDTEWTDGTLVTVPAAPEGGVITWPDGADATTTAIVIQGATGDVPTVQADGTLAFANAAAAATLGLDLLQVMSTATLNFGTEAAPTAIGFDGALTESELYAKTDASGFIEFVTLGTFEITVSMYITGGNVRTRLTAEENVLAGGFLPAPAPNGSRTNPNVTTSDGYLNYRTYYTVGNVADKYRFLVGNNTAGHDILANQALLTVRRIY